MSSAIEEVQLVAMKAVTGRQSHKEDEKATGDDEDAPIDWSEWRIRRQGSALKKLGAVVARPVDRCLSHRSAHGIAHHSAGLSRAHLDTVSPRAACIDERVSMLHLWGAIPSADLALSKDSKEVWPIVPMGGTRNDERSWEVEVVASACSDLDYQDD